MASQVLASGEPVKFKSPCGNSCQYNISLEGPRFHCKELGPDDALIDGCRRPMYMAEDRSDWNYSSSYQMLHNSFQLSWYPNPRPGECDLNERKTLDCSTTLATYNLHIENSRDDTRSITTLIENDRPFWNNSSPLQAQYYYYFFGRGTGELLDSATNVDALRANFTRMQAYSISRAAVQALEGEVSYSMQ